MRARIVRYAAVLALVSAVGCTQQVSDPVEKVARQFGVPRERVLAVIEELGLHPGDLDKYGPGPFPFNYYQQQFEQFAREHGRPPTRTEVDRSVKGYLAKCVSGPGGIEYIFYSTRVHPSWTTREIAMVLEAAFKLPAPGNPSSEDRPLAYVRTIDLRDASVNPPRETYWQKCIQDYLNGQ